MIFDVSATALSAERFAQRALAEHGVRFSVITDPIVRAVTYLDVTREGVEHAVEAVAKVVGGKRREVRSKRGE